MTQEIWSCVAENAPRMLGSATEAMVQSIEYSIEARITDAAQSVGCRAGTAIPPCAVAWLVIAGVRRPQQVEHQVERVALAAGVHAHRDRHAGAQRRALRVLLDL